MSCKGLGSNANTIETQEKQTIHNHNKLHRMLKRWSIGSKGPINTNGCDFKYIFVAIEHVSRYMELFSLVNCSTNTILKTFYDNVTIRFDQPSLIQLDRASYFMSDIKLVPKLLQMGLVSKYSYI